MALNVRNRSIIVIIMGVICLVLNYCWQYRICCNLLSNVAKIRQANEGFRPPIYFTISKKRIENQNFEVYFTSKLHKRNTPSGKNQAIKKLQKVKKPTNLMIISQGRSGSSFVGQIFNQDPHVFYMYEPLLTIERVENINTFVGNNTEQYQVIAARYLRQVLNCNFTNSAYLEYLSRPSHFRMSSRVLKSPPFCSKNVDDLSPSEIVTQTKCINLDANPLNSVCRNYTVKVVKVLEHRIPGRTIENLRNFLNNQNYEIKVLYLVRDPRAFILSMYQSGWIAHFSGSKLVPYKLTTDRFKWYVKRICSQMKENVEFVKNKPKWLQGHVLLLRYEDLILHPWEASRKLFEFVGLRQSPKLKSWLYHNMHAANHTVASVEGRYSTARNSTYSMIRWRLEASIEMTRIIEHHCRPVMNALGYVMTNGSASVQYDLSTSLVRVV